MLSIYYPVLPSFLNPPNAPCTNQLLCYIFLREIHMLTFLSISSLLYFTKINITGHNVQDEYFQNLQHLLTYASNETTQIREYYLPAVVVPSFLKMSSAWQDQQVRSLGPYSIIFRYYHWCLITSFRVNNL